MNTPLENEHCSKKGKFISSAKISIFNLKSRLILPLKCYLGSTPTQDASHRQDYDSDTFLGNVYFPLGILGRGKRFNWEEIPSQKQRLPVRASEETSQKSLEKTTASKQKWLE